MPISRRVNFKSKGSWWATCRWSAALKSCRAANSAESSKSESSRFTLEPCAKEKEGSWVSPTELLSCRRVPPHHRDALLCRTVHASNKVWHGVPCREIQRRPSRYEASAGEKSFPRRRRRRLFAQ